MELVLDFGGSCIARQRGRRVDRYTHWALGCFEARSPQGCMDRCRLLGGHGSHVFSRDAFVYWRCVQKLMAHPIRRFRWVVSSCIPSAAGVVEVPHKRRSSHIFVPTSLSYGSGLIAAPSVALTSAAVIGANLISTFWYQHQIGYHYSLVIVPSLMFGTVYGIARVPITYRKRMVGAVAVCSLAFGYWLSPLPLARSTVGDWSASNPSVVAAKELFAVIPDDAVVSAYHPLTAQLARRERIYSFPNPFQRSLYGPDVFARGDRLPFAEEVEYVMLPAVLDEAANLVWSQESPRFRVVGSNAWWIVYKRL